MPFIPEAGAVTRALKEIQDKLSPYIDKKSMRELDDNLQRCFNEMRIHIQQTVYHQIAKLIDEGKIVEPEDKDKQE